MRLYLPRKRTILWIHRWMGILSAIFLVVVSLTGLALNHTEALGLNRLRVNASWILDRYGMAGREDIRTYRIHKSDTISFLDGQLYLNAEPFLETSEPVGVLDEGAITIIATRNELILLTPENQLIEEIAGSRLPYGNLVSVGRDAEERPVMEAETGKWQPDEAWLQFKPFSGNFARLPLQPVNPGKAAEEQILTHYQGEGMSLYRVLLDLHSGRLFGWGGRTLMDLTAMAILILITSGIGGWVRQSRRRFRIG